MSAPLLAVERFSYWYPAHASAAAPGTSPPLERAALKQVSLEFGSGEFVLVVGPSGCGKSTLIQALLGVVPAHSGGVVAGRVRFAGEDVLVRGPAGVAGKIGLVLQDPESQLTNLDVEGEVAFGPENLALPRDVISARLDEALQVAGIVDLRQRFVYALSGGQKQRVAIAAGLAMRPRVLLLDSPTSNLDPLGSDATLRAIVDLWRAGGVELIVMAARKVDDLLPYATRLLVMDQGRVALDGPPRTVLGRHLATLRNELGVFVPEVCEIVQAAAGPQPTAPATIEEAAALLRALPMLQRAPSPSPGQPGPGSADGVPREASGGGAGLQPAPAARPLLPAAAAPSAPPAVAVEDLHFAYRPEHPVLRGVSLAVARGEFLALLGQNGTGKTTLAKNVAGLYRPSRGVIRLGGVPVASAAEHLRSGRVGYVFQYPDHQFVALTVADELAYGPRARGLGEDEAQARVEAMLELFHLRARRDAPPYSLSIGEKRRLSVATMLVLRPDVLILDEPTTGQDRRNTVTLMEILRREARTRGMAIIQITHDMEQAAQYADRALVLDDGRVAFDGPIAALFADQPLMARCHLKPTPTYAACRLAWPGLDPAPTTPDELARLLAASATL